MNVHGPLTRARAARALGLATLAASLAFAPSASAHSGRPHAHGHAQPPAHRLVLHPDRTAPKRADRAASATTLAAPVAGAGDVTGDGRADAVVRDPGPGSGVLRIYDSNGATQGNPWSDAFREAGSQWSFADELLLADVTGDDLPDVVARDRNADNGTLWIYPNDGDTTGNPWKTRFAAGTGWDTFNAFMIGDVTGDGHADLVARDPSVESGTMWVYPGNGSTTSNPWTRTRIWSGTGWNLANALMLGDVTGDDHPDVVARDGGGGLWVYPSNGSATDNPWTSRFAAGTGWQIVDALALGDVTGDGHPDIVARDTSGALWIYPHNGSATDSNPWTVSRYAAGSGWGFADRILLGDLSGDGRPDLVARVRAAGTMWVYANDGTEDGNPWTSRFAAGTDWAFEDTMMLGDVNGDGRPDVVARDPSVDNGTLWIYPNAGATANNPWTAPRVWAGTGWDTVNMLMLGDVTGDGHPDITVRDGSGDLWVYPHNGSSTGNVWGTGPRFWAGSGWNTAVRLTMGDVNRDGIADLVDEEQDGTLWIYLTGTADPPIQVAGDYRDTTALALGDVYGTGRLDLVTRDASGQLWIHRNDGSTTADPWTTRTAAGSGWAFASAFLL